MQIKRLRRVCKYAFGEANKSVCAARIRALLKVLRSAGITLLQIERAYQVHKSEKLWLEVIDGAAVRRIVVVSKQLKILQNKKDVPRPPKKKGGRERAGHSVPMYI